MKIVPLDWEAKYGGWVAYGLGLAYSIDIPSSNRKNRLELSVIGQAYAFQTHFGTLDELKEKASQIHEEDVRLMLNKWVVNF